MTSTDTIEDPRPYLGEPVSIDLLNTEWQGSGPKRDLLTDVRGLEIWLHTNGLDAPHTADTLERLVEARAAIRDHVEQADDTATERVNAILATGSFERRLSETGPVTTASVSDPAALPAWIAVENYLELIGRGRDRIRQCGHSACILYFFDTSPKGNRRWHSMAVCGNRAKAARNYERSRHGGS
jgi:predicted RNA-binding Zn ribbon-like protein